jgi:transposase
MGSKERAEAPVREIRRRTRKQYSAEEKIRIVLAGLRGEDSIAELCRREGLRWSRAPARTGNRSSRAPRSAHFRNDRFMLVAPVPGP